MIILRRSDSFSEMPGVLFLTLKKSMSQETRNAEIHCRKSKL